MSTVVGTMEVTLVNARGLKNNEFLGGGIDPYVLIQYRGQEHKSSIARGEGSNPTWNEKFNFRVEFPVADDEYKLLLNIMDHDTFSEDDYLGRTTVHLKEVFELGIENGTYELHPHKYSVVGSDQSFCGEIQVAISFSPKRKRQGKDGFTALKLDMSKAFDRVEWPLLRAMLHKFGFHDKWITLIMECVSTVDYHISHDGDLIGPIFPTRGLRQGDPISPYLFIIIAEGLSAMIKDAETKGLLHGIQVARGAPKISHLLFADDSFLFCKATIPEITIVKGILDDYASASGQLINFNKSSLFFSPNVTDVLRSSICNILQVVGVENSGMYLGLPSLIGRNKKEILGFLKNRVLNKIHSWNHKFLSKAGKEVLIKSVIQALPSYAMSVFRIPNDIVRDIECAINAFWWGAEYGSRKGIRWKAWANMCVPKDWGGIGFRRFDLFNTALLCKQAWRLIQHPSSLAAKIFQAKYYPGSSFLEARTGNNPSYVWSSLLTAKEVIRSHSRWRIGDGNKTRIWKDRWLPDNSNPNISTPPYPFMHDATVSALFTDHSKSWDISIIQEIFNHRDAALISNIPLPISNRDDKLIWMGEDRGHFTVKSCYRALLGDQPSDRKKDWASLWKCKVPPKVKSFMWQACSSCLPTVDLLRAKKVVCNPICRLCSASDESILHLLAYCPIATQCWSLSNINMSSTPASSIGDWFAYNRKLLDNYHCSLMLMICWYLWYARNEYVWNNNFLTPSIIVEKAKAHLSEWTTVQDKDEFSPHQEAPSMTRWTKPAQGQLKLNVDAAVNTSSGRMGFGWILRDDHGEFKAAASIPWCGLYSVKEAEAMAVREALSWLKENHTAHCHVETDALLVVQGLNSSNFDSQFDLILYDVKDLLTSLVDVSLSFVKRSANRIAHLMARESLSMSDRRVWTDFPPSFIVNSLSVDLY